MDSLTQIAIGIATAEVFLGDKIKNRTFIYGAILGTLPDLDVFIGKFFEPVTAVSIHRSFSHSLIFYLLLSLPLGFLLHKIENGKVKLFLATQAVFGILLTHSLIDIFTTWGTQLFWPLPYKLAFKSIFVVDVFYTLPWIVILFLIFKSNDFGRRKKLLRFAFLFTTSYLLLGLGIKFYVLNKFENALKQQNISYKDLIVKPTFSNLILWNANVKTDKAFFLADYSLFDSQPIQFKKYVRDTDTEQQIQDLPVFKQLQDISEGWYIVNKEEDAYVFNDLRFGLLKSDTPQEQFAFSYRLVNSDKKWDVTESVKKNRDGKLYLLKIFNRLKGN